LEGARACFARDGFNGATTAEISAEAGVSVANLYQYFPTKDALVLALVEDDLQRDLVFVRTLEEAPTFAAGLDRASRAMAKEAVTPDGLRLRLDVLAEATHSASVAKAVLVAEERLITALAEVLERARTSGELQFPEPSRIAATLVVAMTDGLYPRLASEPRVAVLLRASDAFVLRALGARSANSPD
jgi:TetR/AcrR family transcriptional regulator, repressor for uid operon